jgi:hypothetical protein
LGNSIGRGCQLPEGNAPFTPRTKVSIKARQWLVNGEVTYRGTRAEGLLLNVRMVNSVFEDRHKPDFDPEANTSRFLARLDDYAAPGVKAFTICLQGGRPRYEGALNSAFNPDGSLRESYLARVRRVIEACDRIGLVVILGCFYQRQDQVLKDEDAVRAGVKNAAGWIRKCGFQNVVLEIANEFGHSGFDHPWLRTDGGQVELIRLAQKAAPGLLVSTAGLGDGGCPDGVAKAADFLLIHFNDTALDPLGIEHWWFQFYDGGPKVGRHPSQHMGMPARDLARIAYCMLKNGRWHDKQVIPEWFVAQTASPTHNVHGLEMRFKLNAENFSHGWELPARLTGERGRSGRGIPADARSKPGSGGQLIAFVPSLNLVVTRQTGSSGEWPFEEYLRQACAAAIRP